MNLLKDFLEHTERVILMPETTPIHRLFRLEKSWGYKKIYIKRDDMTGIGTGGNKIRSLEYILGEALKVGSDKILVSGPAQSNLCMLTAAACAKLGLSCEVIHNSSEPENFQGNLLLNHILGVKSHFIGDVDSTVRAGYVEELYEQLEKQGYNPYVVKNGATTGRGALGYVAAIPELMKQCREENIENLTIFAPGGNGGVATGLIYGNAMFGYPFKIVVMSVEDDAETLKRHIVHTIKELEEITGLPIKEKIENMCSLVDDYRGAGWGVNTSESSEEVYEFAKLEGVFIENVYNSKVLVGMKNWIREGHVEGDVCYLHTGGLGSLFSQY
ncbi:MAG: pyridoxal-phosphate dependent enzyme [Clostridium sp.]